MFQHKVRSEAFETEGFSVLLLSLQKPLKFKEEEFFMFNNVKAKKRITQFIIAFVVICMSVTGSIMLLEDAVDNASAATTSANVASSADWSSALSGRGSGDVVNMTLTASFSVGSTLTTIPTGVTVNLNMNGNTIYRDYEGDSAGFMNYSYPAKSDYFGIIRNSGTLNITGTGTIRMKQVAEFQQGDQRDNAIGRMASIVNYGSGVLNISSGINVQTYSAYITPNSSSSSERYADVFVYSMAVYNEGTVNSTGKIHAGTFTAGVANTGTASYHYAFAYGIYGGTVNVTGGTITAEALSGALEATTSCKDTNQVCNYAVGVFSKSATIKGDTTITTKATSWRSQDERNAWSGGVNMSWSVGVMYTGTNYPVIGAAVDINSSFTLVADSTVVYVPGSDKSYTVVTKSSPGSYGRRAYPVAGLNTNFNEAATNGSQSSEVAYNTGNGIFGNGGSLFNANSTYYIAEEAFYKYGRTSNTSYLTNVSGYSKSESGGASAETQTAYITSGAPGQSGTQFITMYRYYNGSFNAANLYKVSATSDSSVQNGAAIVKVGGSEVYTGTNADASASLAYSKGGDSRNERYYKFESKTTELVPVATFASRSVEKTTDWTLNGTPMTSNGVTASSANTVVVYLNYVLKSPAGVRVVAANRETAIDQYTTGNTFNVSYTGAPLVPGTDFNLGIIDIGADISNETNNPDDDSVVTNVYDITGAGSGSGNNATAVTYRYSADQSTWITGLPKDVGTYFIEVNVNADTTYAASGTYNRQGTTAVIKCTITKANLTIEGASSRTGVYGSTYGELIPYGEYKAVGLSGDQLEGSWSLAGVNAGDYPDAGQHTIELIWTPLANSKTSNNYNITRFPVNLVVDKRAVTVNAGTATVAYGDSNPTFDIAYGNLAANDEAKKSTWLAASDFEIYYNGEWTEYTAGIPAGNYTLRITKFGGAADENNTFSVNTTDGTFTVQKRSIVYHATATDRAYNGQATVDVKLSYVSGSQGADAYDAFINTTGTMPAGANAGEGKVVDIDMSSIAIKNSANYQLVVDNINTLTVNIAKADPTGVSVVAEPATITYDSSKGLEAAASLKPTASAIAGTWAWENRSDVPTVDVATYTAVFTPADTTNYKVLKQQVTLTVEQKEVVVTTKSFDISYGDAVPAISGSITYTGFTGADSISTIGASGGTDATTTYTRGGSIGTYPINVITTLASTNYYFTAVDSQINVAPRALTIKANDMSVVYGANTPELDESDVTGTGFYGSDSLSSLGGTPKVTTVYVPGSPVGTYDIVVSGYTAANYAITYAKGTLTVEKATLTVTPNNVKGVTYGADAPAYRDNKLYTITGFKGTDTIETVAIEGLPAFSTGYSSGKSVGTYPVTVSTSAMSAANYTFVGAEGALVVGKATPTVTMVPGATVVNSHKYSEAIFDGTEVVVNPNKGTMEVEGSFKFADATAVAVWGNDGMFDAVFTPVDTTNYATTTVKVYLEILEKTISGTPIIQGSAMVGSTLTVNLGSMDPAVAQYYTFQWYVNDAPIAGANSTSYKLAASDLGKAVHVVLTANTVYGFSGTAKSTKTDLIIEALLETTAAQLKVVLPENVTYDALGHAATVSIADGYNAQYFGSITVKYNGSTSVPVNAGTYNVTVDVSTPAEPQGGYPDNTYYGPATGIAVGSFVIGKAPYTVSVLPSDKVYDGTTTAYATVTGSGLKDEMDDVRIAEGSKFAFADAKVGNNKTVDVTAMQLTGAQAGNYEIVVVPGTAAITPATLKARATGVNKTYDGSAMVSVTFSNIEGYAAVDSASTVQIKNGAAIAVSANAGTQALTDITYTLEGSSAANYVLEITNAATVVISPAVPNVTAPVISGVVYDAAKTLQTIDLAGYTTSNGFWQFDDLSIVPTVTQKTYSATFYSNNKNYTNYTTLITVNVSPKAVVLTADDKTVSYGLKAPVFTITASGLTGTDTLADIGGSCTPVCVYAAGSDIGSYTINLNNALSDDNYTFSTVPGTLTVSPARLNVTATAVDKVYDGTTAIRVNFSIVSGKFSNDDVNLSTTTVSGTAATANAGPTTVTYAAPALIGSKADNYELYISPASGVLSVEIAKADVSGVVFPADGQVEFGYDLSYATFLKNGVGDGTFAYENARTTVPGAIGLYTNYKVIFTPTDSRNYNSQEAYVSLEVVKCVLDYVVGVAGTPQQGESLAVVFTGMPAHATEYVRYQWYRADSKGVEAIPDATGAKYVATADDVGYTLVVITYFSDAAPYVYADTADIDSIDGEVLGIIGQAEGTIKELTLTFWQRLMDWIRRLIEALTGITLGLGM